MKNISLILASTLSIAFTSPIVDKAISKPTVVKGDRLPKIGIIKSPDRGSHSGCSYWQSDRTTKKLETNYDVARRKLNLLIKNTEKTGSQSAKYEKISEELGKSITSLGKKEIFSFFDGNKAKMNFNGSDASLNLISERKITDTKRQQTYKADNTVIKLTTTDTWHSDATADVKGTISIQNSNASKTIQVRGYCFAD